MTRHTPNKEAGPMRIARLALALVLTAGLMLAGLGSMGPKASAQGGKVIRFGVNRAPETLDPVTTDANPDIWAFTQIYQQLVKVNVKGDGFEPDLAEKWTTSPDGRTWTFFMRKNAKFSNGDPVKAGDAVFSLKRAHDTKGPWQWALEAVEDIRAKDDYTVVISLKEPWAPFLADISLFSNSIMPEKVFKGAKDEDFANKPVGSGPFMLADWKKGEDMVMKANPHYYEPGFPKSQELRLKYIPDDNARIIALQSGDVDGIDYPPFSRMEELRKDPKLEAQLNPSTAVAHLSLNIREAPLSNVKLRQALAYATDRAAISKAVCFGNCTPATTFLPMTTPLFNKGSKGYAYDLNKAKQLLKESGVATPVTLKVMYRSNDAVQGPTAVALKEMWGKLGVNLELEPLERTTETQRYRANQFQIRITGWTNDIPDPSQLASYALGFTESQSYHSGYQSAEMDGLLAKGLREVNPEKRRQVYYEIQELALRDSPLIILYYAPYTIALNKKVKGFVQLATGPWIFKSVTVE
jgi:peptide/nickel transport system substrate-binding protein